MKPYIKTTIIAFASLVGVLILSAAYKYKYKANETITVTGLAERDFVSDQIVWAGNYSRKTMELRTAYAQLKKDEQTIREYLTGKGVKESELVFSSVSIEKEFNTRYDSEGRTLGTEFTGYNLKQSVTVDSRDIEKVEKISREVTELIESGIEFEPSPAAVLDAILPSYIHYIVYQAQLTSRASEQSARMVAMKSATDNAKNLVKDLTLEYNTARQASITNEILEISTAQLALG
jgi:ATP synthase F1 gamma subunit